MSQSEIKPFYGTTRPGQPAHVALTIKGQIGFGSYAAVGAHNFSYIEKPDPGLTFLAKIIPTGLSRPRIMRVFITLNGMDTYDVKVTYIPKRGAEPKTHFEAHGIYNDQISRVIFGLDKEG